MKSAIFLYTEMAQGTISNARWNIQEITKETLQGSVISPLLANLFLHYAFNHWMARYHWYDPFAG
jgi:retron-type reverse transcriptase